jgi:molybdopterin-guanine dinucleotide biosynthesis protein A
MRRTGFILVGGASTRMGQDKALLPYRGSTLVEHIAATVVAAAGSAVLVGNPEKYSRFGYPVIADPIAGAGPLAGLCAALSATHADWNLVVACDMPAVSAGFLGALLDAAERSGADALLPVGPSGRPEPLCAVYHRRALPAIRQALECGVRKVLQGLAGLSLETWQVWNTEHFENCNTPREWLSFLESPRLSL